MPRWSSALVRTEIFHWRWVPAGVFGASLCIASCGSHIKVVIHGANNLNDQHSCYVLVRTIEDKPTSGTTYAQSVELAKKPDESVKAVEVLLPRQTRELSFSPPEKGQLVVEALLQSPDPNAWRVYVPPGVDEIEINVTEKRACVVKPATGQGCSL